LTRKWIMPTVTGETADMIHIGVVNTVLSGLVRSLDDPSGSRRPALGSLLLPDFEYSAYIILDPKI
jgi:hypothetical protein